jgi:hypothetical protein
MSAGGGRVALANMINDVAVRVENTHGSNGRQRKPLLPARFAQHVLRTKDGRRCVIAAGQKWRRDIAVVANQSKPIRPIYQGSLHDSFAFTLLTPLQNVLNSTCANAARIWRTLKVG